MNLQIKKIKLVDQYKDAKHNEFILRLKGCFYYIFCCINRERVNYNSFMRKAEEGTLKMMNSTVSTQTPKIDYGTQVPTPTITPTPPKIAEKKAPDIMLTISEENQTSL